LIPNTRSSPRKRGPRCFAVSELVTFRLAKFLAAAKRAWVPAFAGMSGLILMACAHQAASLPARPVAAGPRIAIEAQPVPQNRDGSETHVVCPVRKPQDPPCDNFAYAGGLWLTSPDTSRLHGMSDLKVWPDGRLLAVGDEGDLLEARIVLGPDGRLQGVRDARLTPLTGEDGQPLQARGKEWSDSEGIAEFPNGDRIVSLEEHDRILLYPRGGGPPRLAPSPNVKFPFNLGMEALATYPQAGADAYLVGGEASGQLFVCHLKGGCAPDHAVPKKVEYGLSAVAPISGGRLAYLLRAYDPIRGNRVILHISGPAGQRLGEWKIEKPATVDNFEGLAALPNKTGGVRFYLISDDNFSKSQRTLLLAFDWKPISGR